MRRLAVPLLLAAVLSGCSATEPGTPSAGQAGSAPATGSSTASSTGSAPVARPKAVDMKALDPCTLYTAEVKSALGVRLVTERPALADYGQGSRTCSNNYEDATYSSSIYTLVNGGVDRLRQTVGEAELTPARIAGYPAYVDGRDVSGLGPACDVYLDAHDGQLLLVNAVGGFGEDRSTVDGACAQAKKLAEAVGAILATR
ncbi:DUF3558 domain-containing protein [Lentzea sp. CC55]|uniref:DUF3558 domain-containing protein n=1 Tax=Lentzea sp. CC55 TaxID=2884909 RepID=UPI001F19967A|nr:DUF3558 domain-containing protein [Lentzea sp. CC55]MCG8924481.1 DUF3558 domain-containing protein [Lentzea sp. CC55]